MKNNVKLVAILFIALFLSSCVEDGDFTIPTLGNDKEYSNLKPLSEIAELYQGSLVEFEEDLTTYGYVISSDRKGNFYKTIIIQDKPENPTIGFEVLINDFNLNARYAIGRKIFIKLKGLFFNKKEDAYQIGIENTFRNGVDRIGPNDYVYFIDRSSEISPIIPTKLKPTELTDTHINTLVKINNLQSETLGLTYANPSNTTSVDRSFVSCETFETIILTTSGFADYKSALIPDERGSITAVLNKFEDEYQLFIRDTNDVNLTEEYGCFKNPVETSLANIKTLFTGTETTITENLKVKVVITSDLAKNNITNQNAFAQDASAAIALHFSDTYDLNLGDEIEIGVGGLKLSKDNGLLQLNLATSNILSITTGTLPSPEIITFEQALSGDYESKLVKIEGVQFKNITKTYAGTNTITSDCTNELKVVSVTTDATFSNNQVSDKKGTITGVMTQINGIQIYIRDETDVTFTETYACTSNGGGSTNAIFFSELADPNNNAAARFIEIYNAGTENIDLTGWVIRRYTNSNSTSNSSINLTGSTINTGQAFVIAAQATAFQTAFGFAPDLNAGTGGPADSNGDDNLELVDPNGNVVDVFGLPGEDGSNTNHEFEDGRAYRKTSVTQGNATYTFVEWGIWNDSGSAGTTNAPQDAPGAFTPKVR